MKNYSDLKVGDILTVRSESWYRDNCIVMTNGIYGIDVGVDDVVFSEKMVPLCGKQVTVKELLPSYHMFKNCILIYEDEYIFHTWMFEEFEFSPIRKI